MMRGPSYDDNYIARKMTSMQNSPTFMPPGRSPMGGYMQPLYQRGQHRMYFRPGVVTEVWYLPRPSDRLRFLRDWRTSTPNIPYLNNDSYEEEGYESSSVPPSKYSYTPSARTQLILNRVALTQPRGYSHVPPPRIAPRMAPPPPPYYDDYYGGGGYGGYSPYAGYGYGGGYYPPPPPPMPRYSGYSPYLEDDYDLSYVPRYRPTRLSDSLVELEKEKQLRRSLSPSRFPISSSETTTTTTSIPPTDFLAKHYSPSQEAEESALRKSRLSKQRAIEPRAQMETEGDRHLARMSHKYPSLSEPQMLQDQVDKMRIRLKSMAFSLDPSGPVPDIVIPQRSRRVDSEDLKKKYSSGPRHFACFEFAGPSPQWKRRARARCHSDDSKKLCEISRDECIEAEENTALDIQDLPRLSTRRHHYYPEDEHMKDNLRIKCLSHYKTTRTQAEKDPEKLVLKDRLSMKIHNYLCDTLTPDEFQSYLKTYRSPGHSPYRPYYITKSRPRSADYWKPKGYYGDQVSTYSLPTTSRYASAKGSDSAKWEEPDKVYATSSTTERKPYSKVETGSSFFSTYGYTNRMKDTVAEKCKDYYYYGDENKRDRGSVRFSDSSCRKTAEVEDDEAKKERRKKKKSKEREELAAITAVPETAATSSELTSETSVAVETAAATEGQVSATSAESAAAAPVTEAESELDEKEKKRLEKRKRKAEREAAAKAAMEAELAALAEAELELAKLEAESANLNLVTDPKPASEEKASEKPADKCESEFYSKEFECQPTSFDENLQEHEIEPEVPDDPVISDDHVAIEEAYDVPKVEEPYYEEPPSVPDEDVYAMQEEALPPQIEDYECEPLGTEMSVEIPQEPSLDQEEPPVVEIEPHLEPEDPQIELERIEEPYETYKEPQEEISEQPIDYYDEVEPSAELSVEPSAEPFVEPSAEPSVEAFVEPTFEEPVLQEESVAAEQFDEPIYHEEDAEPTVTSSCHIWDD